MEFGQKTPIDRMPAAMFFAGFYHFRYRRSVIVLFRRRRRRAVDPIYLATVAPIRLENLLRLVATLADADDYGSRIMCHPAELADLVNIGIGEFVIRHHHSSGSALSRVVHSLPSFGLNDRLIQLI